MENSFDSLHNVNFDTSNTSLKKCIFIRNSSPEFWLSGVCGPMSYRLGVYCGQRIRVALGRILPLCSYTREGVYPLGYGVIVGSNIV